MWVSNFIFLLREGFQKQKWKFKMAFAIKGRGVSRAIKAFCTSLYYEYIVVEVTMIMAKYTSSWQSAAGAAKECQYWNQL